MLGAYTQGIFNRRQFPQTGLSPEHLIYGMLVSQKAETLGKSYFTLTTCTTCLTKPSLFLFVVLDIILTSGMLIILRL